ncbi:MAG: hypothetical protein Q8O00_02465 [Holophaga sp.]|nr:hypothetical protein [Holophaga sp.]
MRDLRDFEGLEENITKGKSYDAKPDSDDLHESPSAIEEGTTHANPETPTPFRFGVRKGFAVIQSDVITQPF